MLIKHSIIKGSLLLSLGRLGEKVFQFLRNMIVARLITPQDFGIAALFILTVNFLEMISNFAVETLMVQSPHGDEPSFQETSQLVEAARGLLIALFIFLASEPLSTLFNVPETKWGFRLLALVPLIRGLRHQDVARMQRHLDFKPRIIRDVSSQLISLFMAWPIAALIGNFTAILYLLIIQTLIWTLMSHFFVQRPFKLGWDPIHAKAIISFGWPLLINGILMFLILQGDRFVIGAADYIFQRETYSKTELGFYSAVFILVSAITEGITSVLAPIMLPLLSRVQEDNELFLKRCRSGIFVTGLLVNPLSIIFIFLGGWLLVLVYGKQYEDGSQLMTWIGIAFSLRLFRVVFATIALAKGDSPNMTITNAFRALSFALAFLCAVYRLNILWIAVSTLIGELFAIGISLKLLKSRLHIPIGYFLRPFAISSGGILIAILFWFNGIVGKGFFANIGITFLFSMGISFVFVILLPDLAEECKSVVDRKYLRRFIPFRFF